MYLFAFGSSCHLKGAPELVELFQKAIPKRKIILEGLVTLSGSFCTRRCNRVGVTVTVDDEVFPGITKESFKDFFNDKILGKIQGGV